VPAASDLPSGTVTFPFTDIEGSTALLKQLGRDGYEGVLGEQAGIVRASFAAHGGKVVDTQSDSFFAAFRAARWQLRSSAQDGSIRRAKRSRDPRTLGAGALTALLPVSRSPRRARRSDQAFARRVHGDVSTTRCSRSS
jgi:class 3 adenylate cyclase